MSAENTKRSNPNLLGGWVTTEDKAEDWVEVGLDPTGPKRRVVRVPITSTPQDSIPIGPTTTKEPGKAL